MLKHLRAFVVLGTMLAADVSLTLADEAGSKEWMKYLGGAWTYQHSDGTAGEAKFSFRAKRSAMIGVFKQDDSTAVEIGGWRPDKQVTMVNGFGSGGDFWQLEYKTLSGKGGTGTIQGSVDGVSFTADFAATVVSQNNWKWTITGKTPEGKDVKLSAEFVRKAE